METIKTIPFYILFIRSLAADFENKNITWKKLLTIIFNKDTNIYKEFADTLMQAGIALDYIVDLNKTVAITDKKIVNFQYNYKEETIINFETGDTFVISKRSTVNKTIAKVGYYVL